MMVKNGGAAILICAALALMVPTASWAKSHESKKIAALEKKVASLEKRLARLEKIRPTFTGFMPNFSERFHVLHLAGGSEDWQLASHELMELKRLVQVSEAVDPKNGKLFAAHMTSQLDNLMAAVEHGNKKKFEKEMQQTVVNCNACHTAVGSAFIKIGLDVESGLSMRHPHKLAASKAGAMKHKH